MYTDTQSKFVYLHNFCRVELARYHIFVYLVTFWDLNWDFLQLEIVGVPVGLGLAFINCYTYIKFVCIWYYPPLQIRLKVGSQKVA